MIWFSLLELFEMPTRSNRLLFSGWLPTVSLVLQQILLCRQKSKNASTIYWFKNRPACF